MARAMADTGYKLKFQEILHARLRHELHRARRRRGAEGTVTWLRSLPNEEAGSNAEQSRPSSSGWAGSRPSSPRDPFAVDSWAAAKAFFDALAALPGPDHPRGAHRAARQGRHLRRRRLLRPDPARRRAHQRVPRRHEGRGRQVEAPHAGEGLPLLSPRLHAAPLEDATAPPAYEPLALHDVGAGYGRIEVLHGVDVAVRARRGHRAARPERRRQVHHPRRDERPARRRGAAAATSRAGTSTAPPPTSWPASACATSARAGRSSRTSASPTTSPSPPSCGAQPRPPRRGGLHPVPACSRSGARSWPARCRAASSRCSPWPAASAPTRACCSSTSCRWAWRR